MKRNSKKRSLVNWLMVLAVFVMLMSTATVAYAATQISTISVKTEKNDWEHNATENPAVTAGSDRYTIPVDSIVWKKNVSDCKAGEDVEVEVKVISNEGYVFKDSLKKSNFSISNGEYKKHSYTDDGNIILVFKYKVRGILESPEEAYWDGTNSKPGRVRWSKVNGDVTYTLRICRGNKTEKVAEGLTSTSYDLTPYLATKAYFEKDNVFFKVRAVPKKKAEKYLESSEYTESDCFWDWDKIDFDPYGPAQTPGESGGNSSYGKKNQWEMINGIWYWYDSNGNYARNEFKDINGQRYYFFADGRMATGWQLISNRWYMFDSSGAMMRSRWYDDGTNWYYLEADGKMKTGWFEWNRAKYFFTESGAMTRGWRQIDKNWYFFHPGGNMATNYYVKSADGLVDFYLRSDGSLQTGWIYQNGWKYIEPNSGSHQKGWINLNTGTYYLEPNTATMVTGDYWIDGAWHYFNSDGTLSR